MRIRVLSAAALLSLSACTSWHAQTGPALQVVARHERGPVRVVRNDGSVLVLRTPSVVGDSLVGVGGSPPRRTSVALADVKRVDARELDPLKTGGATVGALLAAGVVGLIVAFGVLHAGLD